MATQSETMQPIKALTLRALSDARVRTLSFAALFFVYALAQLEGYKKAYPTVTDRLNLAQTFGNNAGLKLFFGTPHHLETLGGYAAWRIGGLVALVAAFFGLLAAVRAFRGEEESGRFELVAAGAITRSAAFLTRLAAVSLSTAVLWAALLVGIRLSGLDASGSALLALAVVSIAVVYAGVGLVASQLMPTAGGALQLGGAFFGLDFLVRVVADVGGHDTLHWLTPLGWVEEVRPFSNPQPAVLALPFMVGAALSFVALVLERRRDVGAAHFASSDTMPNPRLRLLRSATELALRFQAPGLGVWLMATVVYAVLVGTLAKSVVSGLTADLRQQLGKLGMGSLTTVEGVLSFFFLFFVLGIALFCCSQLGAARSEEAEGRLETLFALPEGRVGWLSGRLALTAIGAVLIALTAGLGSAVGAEAAGSSVSFPKLLAAGLNCLPAAALFLGAGSLLIAILPRQGVGLAYGLVIITFVWYLVGALLRAPNWLLGVSPFDQIGFVPAASFRAGPAAVMLAVGIGCTAMSLARFRGRDLVGV